MKDMKGDEKRSKVGGSLCLYIRPHDALVWGASPACDNKVADSSPFAIEKRPPILAPAATLDVFCWHRLLYCAHNGPHRSISPAHCPFLNDGSPMKNEEGEIHF